MGAGNSEYRGSGHHVGVRIASAGQLVLVLAGGNEVRFKQLSNPYYLLEASAFWFRVRHSVEQCPQRMSVMMKNKVELIYCILAVATAVMAGIVKCTAATTCGSCGDFFDR